MNNIFYLVKKNYALFIVSIVLIIFYLPKFLYTCPLFHSLGFDSQALFTWYYTAVQGLFPYKDVFYPYGLLAYYKDVSLIAHLMYEAIAPIAFLLTFFLFRIIWKNTLFALLSFLFFFLFTNYFNGETFSNYGFVAIVAACYAVLFAKKEIKKKLVFFIGVGCGLLFSLLHPQGFYLIALFVAGLGASSYLHQGLTLRVVYEYIQKLIFFFLGVLLGFIPFILILISKGAFSAFVFYLSHLSDLTLYGKSPFIPFSTTHDNLFTFAILSLLAFYVSYVIFFKKKKADFSDYLLLQVFFVTLLFENISIIRSVDSLITFLPVLTITIFAAKYYTNAKLSKQFFFTSYMLLFLIIFFCLGFKPLGNFSHGIMIRDANACIEQNKKILLSSQKKFQSLDHVFSFPADPVWYVLTKQPPPYYFNNYDSSAIYAQKKQIAYIENTTINTVIYNTALPKLQDDVPNYIRTPLEFAYILNNFSPEKMTDTMLIFKREKHSDIFHEPFLDKHSVFKEYLLQIDLEAIPRSEGLYKIEAIKKDIQWDEIKPPFDSQNKVLVMLQEKAAPKKIILSITERAGRTTNVTLNACGINNYCIINLSRIPLFYKNRTIVHVTMKPTIGKLGIAPYKESLW